MRVFTTTLLLLLALLSNGQNQLPDLKGMLDQKQVSIKEKWDVKEADNEFQLFFSGLFIFYKDFLSSQDNAQCNFHPSCSVFAIHSIQQKGAFIGALSAFDRLSRCNGYNQKDYKRRNDNFLLDDPVF
ncbi:MAG: membrane protein insertion efficiency factor YidD [Bacteroidia bacterium]